MVNVCRVARLLCGALHLERASVQIRLFEVGYPVCGGTVPTVTYCLGQISFLPPLESVVKYKGTVLPEAESVNVSRYGGVLCPSLRQAGKSKE
jgi:hypothetical protein